MRSGLNEFETDFGFSIAIGIAKGDAAGLFFCGFGIFHDDDPPECYRQVQVDERAMGADYNGGRAFGDMDVRVRGR